MDASLISLCMSWRKAFNISGSRFLSANFFSTLRFKFQRCWSIRFLSFTGIEKCTSYICTCSEFQNSSYEVPGRTNKVNGRAMSSLIRRVDISKWQKKILFFLGTLCLGHVNLVTTCRSWDNLYKWGSECGSLVGKVATSPLPSRGSPALQSGG